MIQLWKQNIFHDQTSTTDLAAVCGPTADLNNEHKARDQSEGLVQALSV